MSKKNPIAYTSTQPVYTGGKYYVAGEVFVTDATKGADWSAVSKGEKAAIEAADPQKNDDPNFDAMNLTALQAYAATVNVASDGLSKADLVTAIKAHHEING